MRVELTKEFSPVIGIDILFRVLPHPFPNPVSAGKQIFLCGGIQGPDEIIPDIHEGDPVENIIDPADELVQIGGVLRLGIPGKIGELDQHTVFFPGLCHAARFHFKVFFIGSEQHPPVAACFDGIDQVDQLVGQQVIGLGLGQHLLT